MCNTKFNIKSSQLIGKPETWNWKQNELANNYPTNNSGFITV